jgi:hypothetical protein
MKKLITILLLATFIGCSKEEIKECECFNVKYKGAHSLSMEDPNGISIYEAVSMCDGTRLTIESDEWLSTSFGVHCFDEPYIYQ